jgi:hypothetical protein
MVSSIIVIGGYTGTAYLSSIEIFRSVPVQSWSSLPNMTANRGSPCACVVYKTKLIVCGGFNDRLINSCEALDLSNQTAGWKMIANMSTTRFGASGNLLPGDKSFLVVGGNAGNIISTCEMLDIASNTWSSAANLSRGPRSAHSSVLFNNNVIVMGGSNGTNGTSVLSTCEQYDAASNTWSTFPSFSTARRLFAAAVVLGKIYIAGGSSASFSTQALNSVEVFHGTSWSSLPSSLSLARESAEAVAFQNKFAVIGGNRTVIEVYDPITSTWNTTSIPAMKIHPLRYRFAAVSF